MKFDENTRLKEKNTQLKKLFTIMAIMNTVCVDREISDRNTDLERVYEHEQEEQEQEEQEEQEEQDPEEPAPTHRPRKKRVAIKHTVKIKDMPPEQQMAYRREQSRVWSQQNREHRLELNRKWQKQNADYLRKQNRQYSRRVREQARLWRESALPSTSSTTCILTQSL